MKRTTAVLGAVISLSFAFVAFASTTTPQLPPLNSPATNVEMPGKFIWFDFATPSIVSQRRFYNSVFGWTFESPVRTDEGYLLIQNRGRPIAGMFSHEPANGAQDGAAWIALMSVPNPDATAATVKANGGSVEVEPVNIAGRGRHAVFRDPAGAVFGALRSESGDPFDSEVDIGGIIWVDLFTRNTDAMAQFYGSLAPFEIDDSVISEEISRKVLSAHGRPRAGIVPVDEEANRSAWVPYVRVEDVEATLEKVIEGGGFAIVAPDERLHEGNVAVIVDPHGGVIGIVKYEYAEGSSQ